MDDYLTAYYTITDLELVSGGLDLFAETVETKIAKEFPPQNVAVYVAHHVNRRMVEVTVTNDPRQTRSESCRIRDLAYVVKKRVRRLEQGRLRGTSTNWGKGRGGNTWISTAHTAATSSVGVSTATILQAMSNAFATGSAATPPPAPEPMYSPTPLYGFRRWTVADGLPTIYSSNEPVLSPREAVRGTLKGQVVTWYESEMDAVCKVTSLSIDAIAAGHCKKGHDTPDWGCHCGIYTLHDPEHDTIRAGMTLVPSSERIISTKGTAVGLVELTGTIIEHEHGSRGGHGRIVELWVTDSYAPDVEGVYPDVKINAVTAPEPLPFTHDPYDPRIQEGRKELEYQRTLLLEDMAQSKRRKEERWLK